MSDDVIMGFEPNGIKLSLSDILLIKQLPKTIKKTKKYEQISASIREIGIIEPPMSTPE